MTLVRPDGSPLPMPMVCEPAKPVSFGMRVTIPVAATVGSSITMAIRARSLNNDLGLSRNSDPITIEVGRVTPVSDPRVQWANEVPGNPLHTPARAARRVTDPASGKEYVEIPYEGTGLLRLRASFQSGVDSGGDFVYATTFNSAVEGVWQADPPSPLTSIGKHPGENELIGVILHLRAKETNNHPEERVLTLRATRTLGGTLESFVTVNIRGYAPN